MGESMAGREAGGPVELGRWNKSGDGEMPLVAVVGAGALGSELCRLLAGAAAKRVLVIDPDILEERNVVLSTLHEAARQRFGESVLGARKAEVLVGAVEGGISGGGEGAMEGTRPGLGWRASCREIADIGLAELGGCKVLVSCVDSTLARVETALAARTLGIAMVDGGVKPDGEGEGRVALFPPGSEAACFLCGVGEARRAELLAYAASSSLGCRAEPAGVSMTGARSAIEAVAKAMFKLSQMLLEDDGRAAEMMRTGRAEAMAWKLSVPALALGSSVGGGWISERIRLTRSETCPWHDSGMEHRLIAMPVGRTIREGLSEIRGGDGAEWVLQLAWPICLRARCRGCGGRMKPRERMALVRRRGVCAHCGVAGQLDPLESIDSIGAGDAVAECTTEELGLPAGQLFQLRRALMGMGGVPWTGS